MRQHRFLLYPAGAPGLGLAVLRASVAVFLLVFGATGAAPGSFVALSLYGLACLNGLGLAMRTSAICAVIVALLIAYADHSAISTGLLAHVLDAAVLALVGPGAFSLDARFFGRATVRLPGPGETGSSIH